MKTHHFLLLIAYYGLVLAVPFAAAGRGGGHDRHGGTRTANIIGKQSIPTVDGDILEEKFRRYRTNEFNAATPTRMSALTPGRND